MPLVTRVRPQVGDIIEIPTPKGLGYAHFAHDYKEPPHWGALLRVFPGTHATRPLEFASMVKQEPAFISWYPLGSACHRKLVTIVANEPLPEGAKAFPTFRSSHYKKEGGRGGPWFLWDGKRQWRVGRLTPEELRKYPLHGIINHTLRVERLVEGWRHEHDDYLGE